MRTWPIDTEADYWAVLARIVVLLDAACGTPEGEELDVLTDLVDGYDARQRPRPRPESLPGECSR